MREAPGGVICSGSIVADTLVRPAGDPPWGGTVLVDSIEHHIGGNGAATSAVLARCGVPVRLLSAVGRDDAGRRALETLREAGVDTRAVVLADAPTSASVVMINRAGDRRFLHSIGASAYVFAQGIHFTAPLAEGMAHYHLASPFTLPHMRACAAECLERARRAGLTTSLDTNWDSTGLWMKTIGPCLPHLDILFMNQDEARMLTGLAEPSAAARQVLEGGAHMAVVKLGARGCTINTYASEVLSPALDVEVLDTTGAGDCFAGGFLAAWLRGAEAAEAGRFANAVAALSVQKIGNFTGVPPLAEIEAWMRTARQRS